MFWELKFPFFKSSSGRYGVNSRMDNPEEKINQVKLLYFYAFS